MFTMQDLIQHLKNSLWNLEQVKGMTDWDDELLKDGLNNLYTILKEMGELQND